MTREDDTRVAEAMRTLHAEHTILWEEGGTQNGLDGWAGFYCSSCGVSESQKDEPCARRYLTNPTPDSEWEVWEWIMAQMFSERRDFFEHLDALLHERAGMTTYKMAWPDKLVFYELGMCARALLEVIR